jgi:hypothetical protein
MEKIRNPKAQIRKKPAFRNLKNRPGPIQVSEFPKFGFPSDFGLRNFGFDLLRFSLGFTQPGDAIAGFPLAALLKEFDALEPFEHVTFAAQRGSRPQTTML